MARRIPKLPKIPRPKSEIPTPKPFEKERIITVRTVPLLNDMYYIFEIDLTRAHTVWDVGVKGLLKSHGVKYATFLSILEVPSPWSYRVNSRENSLFDAVVGDEIENFKITDIYITNVAGVGIGKFYIEWRSP